MSKSVKKVQVARKSSKATFVPVTVVALAKELNLSPKNARRIARSMFTSHEKNTAWSLNAEQVQAFKDRVAKARA